MLLLKGLVLGVGEGGGGSFSCVCYERSVDLCVS